MHLGLIGDVRDAEHRDQRRVLIIATKVVGRWRPRGAVGLRQDHVLQRPAPLQPQGPRRLRLPRPISRPRCVQRKPTLLRRESAAHIRPRVPCPPSPASTSLRRDPVVHATVPRTRAPPLDCAGESAKPNPLGDANARGADAGASGALLLARPRREPVGLADLVCQVANGCRRIPKSVPGVLASRELFSRTLFGPFESGHQIIAIRELCRRPSHSRDVLARGAFVSCFAPHTDHGPARGEATRVQSMDWSGRH